MTLLIVITIIAIGAAGLLIQRFKNAEVRALENQNSRLATNNQQLDNELWCALESLKRIAGETSPDPVKDAETALRIIKIHQDGRDDILKLSQEN